MEGPVTPLDALEQSQDMNALLNAAHRVPHEQLLKFDELRPDVAAEMADPEAAGVEFASLPTLNSILKGHRRGELTVLTGPTGIGKTTLLTQIGLDLCARGVPTVFGSFEIKNTRLSRVMLTQLAGKPLEGDPEGFSSYADTLTTMPMHFLRFFGAADVNAVTDALEYAVDVHDVGHVILDNLQFMLSSVATSMMDRLDAQDVAISRFRRFATEHNVHVTLVIHPRKTDEPLLSTTSVFGNAKATQEADNVIMLQNGKSFRFLDVRKNRYNGNLGVIPLVFDKSSLLYRELHPYAMDAVQQDALKELRSWQGLNTDFLQWRRPSSSHVQSKPPPFQKQQQQQKRIEPSVSLLDAASALSESVN